MSNSNHDPKNKECLLNHLDPICFPSGNVRPVLHIEHDMNGKKFVCPYSVCTCPGNKEDWRKSTKADELREYIHKVFKPKKKDIAGIDREIIIDFIAKEITLAEERGRREVITENTSDGYHTFKELYDHRITLFITLCRWIEKHTMASHGYVWRSKRHSDGELCFGTGTQFVLGIGKSNGNQITYHIPIERWDETDFAETLETAPEWDGHTSDDVIQRLKNL